MAHYVVQVRTPRTAREAFAYLADLSNFAEWDPGVAHAEQVHGDGPGPDAAFDVEVKAIRGTMTLRYRLIDYDEPNRFVARAQSRLLTSVDTITVATVDAATVVTYDAELTLNGVLGLADPVMGFAFRRIGDRAADGLIAALEGERMTEATG